jgi:hypothetical protein
LEGKQGRRKEEGGKKKTTLLRGGRWLVPSPLTVHTIPENFQRGLFLWKANDGKPWLWTKEEEKVEENGVRNGVVWKAIYREGDQKTVWNH